MKIEWLFLLFFTTSIAALAQDPVKVDPTHYRVLFENSHIRVLEYRDKPGDKAPMHSHPSYMTYVAGPGKTKFTRPNGSTSVDDEKSSIFECLPPTQHAMENVGTTDTQEVLIEFKDSPAPCSGTRQDAAGSGPVMTSASNAGIPGPEEEIRRVQDALIDAYIHRDIADLDRILADEYAFIDDDGMVLNKQYFIDSFKSGEDQIISYKRQDDKVRVYGNVAVMTYRYQSKEAYKGRDVSGDFRLTRILVKRDGRWQMVAGQETDISKEPSILATPKDVNTLKLLEQDWLDAYREGDADKMGKILADDFVGRWADGSKQTKGEQLAAIRSGEEKHSANELVECNVRLYGDTAVVTGIQTEQSILEGRDGSGTYSYTDVFVKRDGRWQIVASETKRVTR